MCENANIHDPEIKELCKTMISSQQAEIDQTKAKKLQSYLVDDLVYNRTFMRLNTKAKAYLLAGRLLIRERNQA
jgi:hypothetical protein